MKITGLAGRMALKGRPTVVGVYAAKGDWSGIKVDNPITPMICPYCRGYLHHRIAIDSRVIWQGKRLYGDTVEIIVDPIPPSHIVLGCKVCKMTFTTPDHSYQET